ncbi:sugar nucleotide-binding protein [Brevibacillus sp. GCM10020057]|uniref:sugar nucleotide-binding protein n=1 Tax=Brevibacillus sp. GCM10020057 TaxID=3317327 RepID=UPI0036348354
MSKRKILLLGASGYLGGQILHELQVRQEGEVTATCFSSPPQSGLLRMDVKDSPAFSAFLRELLPDVVIWSLRGNDSADAQELVEQGMPTLLAHLPEQAKLVYLSTDGVFGQKAGPHREDAEIVQLDERNPLAGYCNAKIRGEEFVREGHARHLVVRFGPIYGKNAQGRWDKRTQDLAEALTRGGVVVLTQNLYKSFVHVQDLARAVVELALGPYTGTLHVGPAQKASYYTFAVKMAEELGFDSGLVKADELSAERAGELGIPLDTSLDTGKARSFLQTTFRSLNEEESR